MSKLVMIRPLLTLWSALCCFPFLKDIDKKLNGKRIPIYIEYKKLLIDGKNVIDENKIVSHNDFHVHKLNIHDGQILSIYLEWKPLS